MNEVAAGFEALCGLPGILGIVDRAHFFILKPRFRARDYHYFKFGGYSMTCQVVIDSKKKFIDLYVGMSDSMNDGRVLRRSMLFTRTQWQTLWDIERQFRGYSLYLLGDGGYPLMSWLMVPHRQMGNLTVAEHLFNYRLSRGCAVVENTFALLKGTFRELSMKTQFDVSFVPDIVTCCALLHNMLLKQTEEEVALL